MTWYVNTIINIPCTTIICRGIHGELVILYSSSLVFIYSILFTLVLLLVHIFSSKQGLSSSELHTKLSWCARVEWGPSTRLSPVDPVVYSSSVLETLISLLSLVGVKIKQGYLLFLWLFRLLWLFGCSTTYSSVGCLAVFPVTKRLHKVRTGEGYCLLPFGCIINEVILVQGWLFLLIF